MSVPIVSAFVIKLLGFQSSFILMFLFVICMAAATFTLPKYSLKTIKTGKWADLFRLGKVFEPCGSRWMIWSSAATGVFLQFQQLVSLLLTFVVGGEKLTIALLNALYTLCSVIAYTVYKKCGISDMKWLYIRAC